MVLDAELCGLQVQEVKETLDGLWKGTASRDGKYSMEESVHIRLEDTLFGGGKGRGRGRREGEVVSIKAIHFLVVSDEV